MWDSITLSSLLCIFLVQQQIQNEKNKYVFGNTQRCETLSFFCTNFKLSSNAQYLLNLLHNLNSWCIKWFGKEKERERNKNENLFQQLIKIQRQWCYRAPIKKLSLHWRWHLFQPLLTTLLVPVCDSQPTASHSVFPWMKHVQLMSFKPKQENPLTILPESLDARHKELPLSGKCGLSSGICYRNAQICVEDCKEQQGGLLLGIHI